MVLPTLLLPVTLMLSERDVGYVFAWLWIACSIGCVCWGFFILPRLRLLARACLVVGFLHIALVLLLPLFATARFNSYTTDKWKETFSLFAKSRVCVSGDLFLSDDTSYDDEMTPFPNYC